MHSDPQRLETKLEALMCQSCVETCADLSAGVMVRKDLIVSHENFGNGQSQRTN